MMSEIKRYSLVKPTLQTPFHIDFNWWKQHDNDWRIHMMSCLCAVHQKSFTDPNDNTWIDWVDPQTAEIQMVDGLQHLLMTHCAKEPGFLTQQTTLVDAVFRVFLANGNTPLTPEELSVRTGKPAYTILRTLTGPTIFKGLRPCQV